jgi:hypothetical protein
MAEDTGKTEGKPERSIQAVLDVHKPRLLALEGVVGVGRGLCHGEPCVKVMVITKTPDLARKIGARLDGYPVEIIESGEIRAIESK